jgi:hypothetical protein
MYTSSLYIRPYSAAICMIKTFLITVVLSILIAAILAAAILAAIL